MSIAKRIFNNLSWMVVSERKTRRQVIKAVMLPLEQKKANLIGVILNNRTYPIPEKIYKRV